MQLRSGKTKMLPSAWTLGVQRRLIAKHTVPMEKARRVARVVAMQAALGTISLDSVPNALALTLARTRDSADEPALISVDTALKIDAELAPSAVRSRLRAGLVVATLDTWNLHKLAVPLHFLCYMGNSGERPTLRDLRSLAQLHADMARFAAERIANARSDFKFVKYD